MVWSHVRRILGLTDERTQSATRPYSQQPESDATEQEKAAALTDSADSGDSVDSADAADSAGTTRRLATQRGGARQEEVEVGTELDTWLTNTQQAQAYQWAPDDGITVSPTPITLGQEVMVRYAGMLARNGANRVFLHYGYGPGPWRHVSEIAMDQQPDGSWSTQIRADQAGRLSFCFRDAAANWDNNNGRDWSYEVHGGDHWPR